MAVEILMPELGESVHEGTVSRWLKKVGDFVKEDEPVVEIMTDKVNQELGAPASGVLTQILIEEGQPVAVFAAMGLIEDSAATSSNDALPAAPPTSTVPEPVAQVASEPIATPTVSSNGERKWFTPLVKSMAKEAGLTDAEMDSIAGTGTGGRVTKKDVESYLASRGAGVAPIAATVPTAEPKPQTVPEPKPAAPSIAGPDQTLVPLSGLRKMIAEAMVRSAAVPTVSTVTQVDVSHMVAFRERNKDSFLETYGVKLTYTPFFIKALAETLQEFPLVNAQLMPDNQIAMNKGVHIGVAVALGAKGDEGLIVPVIRDCHSKTLVDVARDLDEIAKKARGNKLSVSDVQGGTFTLTNPGTYGALFGTPMINAPQAGILGAYAITKQPVIRDDMIAIRSIMHLVLTYDHRLIDGLLAGRFLAGVRDRLEKFDFFK
jgi:pyruvate/2-oxoglutarate dehydrogenase complex dihydrolipoamide acyltransferase (E2) component